MTWQIAFHLQSVVSYGTYKLRLALASATLADLQGNRENVKESEEVSGNPHFGKFWLLVNPNLNRTLIGIIA
ncbi:hypothetical protein Syun_014073 [Stephania yunnanensis]|uniref:Uncharacterized protein n=1 Tax=Stephania yunnanensis TaxID=152371 RepID=A0AAP0JIL5_9MAGN